MFEFVGGLTDTFILFMVGFLYHRDLLRTNDLWFPQQANSAATHLGCITFRPRPTVTSLAPVKHYKTLKLHQKIYIPYMYETRQHTLSKHR